MVDRRLARISGFWSTCRTTCGIVRRRNYSNESRRTDAHSVVKYFKELLQEKVVIREAHPVTLDNSEPEPDIAVVRSPYTDYFARHPFPQDIYWLVEISNKTLKLDLDKKSVTYARNSIPEYWVIDLVNKKLIVHTQPVNNFYSQIQTLTTGTVSPQAFPDIAIALDKMLLF